MPPLRCCDDCSRLCTVHVRGRFLELHSEANLISAESAKTMAGIVEWMGA